jgi:hypothetical protein
MESLKYQQRGQRLQGEEDPLTRPGSQVGRNIGVIILGVDLHCTVITHCTTYFGPLRIV